MFVVYGFDLIVKVWFVFIVLALGVHCFSWRCSWSFLVVPLYLSFCICHLPKRYMMSFHVWTLSTFVFIIARTWHLYPLVFTFLYSDENKRPESSDPNKHTHLPPWIRITVLVWHFPPWITFFYSDVITSSSSTEYTRELSVFHHFSCIVTRKILGFYISVVNSSRGKVLKQGRGTVMTLPGKDWKPWYSNSMYDVPPSVWGVSTSLSSGHRRTCLHHVVYYEVMMWEQVKYQFITTDKTKTRRGGGKVSVLWKTKR